MKTSTPELTPPPLTASATTPASLPRTFPRPSPPVGTLPLGPPSLPARELAQRRGTPGQGRRARGRTPPADQAGERLGVAGPDWGRGAARRGRRGRRRLRRLRCLPRRLGVPPTVV